MDIQRCLILDTETTSLEESAQIIEIGAVLYSVSNQCVLQEFATLLPAESNEAEKINRIKVSALVEMEEMTTFFAKEMLKNMCMCADVYVAHNAEFDSKQLAKSDLDLPDRPWVCTMADFKWPLASREQGSVINLALDHGIGVASAHRALTDCRLIASLFDRMEGLQSMFQLAMRPKGLFQALVSFDDREKAKQSGFKWQPETKQWTRTLALEDAAKLTFKTRRLDAA